MACHNLKRRWNIMTAPCIDERRRMWTMRPQLWLHEESSRSMGYSEQCEEQPFATLAVDRKPISVQRGQWLYDAFIHTLQNVGVLSTHCTVLNAKCRVFLKKHLLAHQ